MIRPLALVLAVTVCGCAAPVADRAQQDAHAGVLGEALYAYAYCYRRVPHVDECPRVLEDVAHDRAAYIARYGGDPLTPSGGGY